MAPDTAKGLAQFFNNTKSGKSQRIITVAGKPDE